MSAKPQAITGAYRADLAERNAPFGSGDDTWLAVGSLLDHAAAIGGEDVAAARSLRDEAYARAAEHVTTDRVSTFRLRYWENRANHPADAVLVLTEDASDAGAPRMTAALLDGLLAADASLPTVTRGRALARRARVASRLGWLAEAQDRASDLLALGEREHEPELVGLSWVTLGAISQMRGNYPDFERAAGEVGRMGARIPSRYLERLSRLSQMIVAGVRKDFSRALDHGWAVYRSSIGFPIEQGEALLNMGQALLEAGHADPARAAFARVISARLPARFILPALGGLALASAKTARDDAVLWATGQAAAFDVAIAPKYALAYALIECASACEFIGRMAEGGAARARAAALADTYKFHELTFRAEEKVTETPQLDGRAQAVAREVVTLEPEHLPDHVELLSVA